MGKEEIDTFRFGLCPKCMGKVIAPQNSTVGICSCGERFNFQVAHLLLVEAIYQGRIDVVERIAELLPDIFSTSHGRGEVANIDLLESLELKDIKKKPALFKAVAMEGADAVNDLILVRQEVIKQKYGINISRADAATIIAFKNIMRLCEEGEGGLTKNIVVQDLNDLEENTAGEFALSYRNNIFKSWIPACVEGNGSLFCCQPEISVRYENNNDAVHAYIKSDLDTFVIAYRSINFPRGSKIYIFNRGGAGQLG